MSQTDEWFSLRQPENVGVRAIYAKQFDRGPFGSPWPSVQSRLCAKGLCVLLGERGPAIAPVSDWVRTHGSTLMIVEQKPLPLDWLRRYAPRLDFLMVDADYMDDIEDTVDFCMQVRRATPSLPLILLSSEVRGHDLTCERMMACDVTLRIPVQGQMLTDGVKAAYANNRHFLSSQH